MKSLKDSIKKVLRSNRGETLVEAIVSILLLAILMTTVTAMIQTSLRLTANSMRDAEELQSDTFNLAIAGTHPDFSPGVVAFETKSPALIKTQHDIDILEDTGDIVFFYPDAGQFED